MHPIGVFDSGIGGFSVLREIRRKLPHARLLYIADQEHVPYGERSADEVRSFSRGMTAYLAGLGCEVVVVACNTASAAALYTLREEYPRLRIVGMEPALKPAVLTTKTKKVGILATAGTFRGEPFLRLKERYGQGVEIVEQACPGLAALIEQDDPAVSARLREWIEPMLTEGVDRIVLGCTHYPLVKGLIASIVGTRAEILDPSEAVAAQAVRMSPSPSGASDAAAGGITILTTAKVEGLRLKSSQLLGEEARFGRLSWQGRELLGEGAPA